MIWMLAGAVVLLAYSNGANDNFEGVAVSTTHVTCGALFGTGSVSGQARWGTTGRVLSARVVTVPVAAVTAGIAATLLK